MVELDELPPVDVVVPPFEFELELELPEEVEWDVEEPVVVVPPPELVEVVDPPVVCDEPEPLRAKYAPAPATATTTMRTMTRVAAAIPRRELELGWVFMGAPLNPWYISGLAGRFDLGVSPRTEFRPARPCQAFGLQ